MSNFNNNKKYIINCRTGGLVVAPTGAGKTHTFIEKGAEYYLKGKRFLYVTNKKANAEEYKKGITKFLGFSKQEAEANIFYKKQGAETKKDAKIWISMHVYFKPWMHGNPSQFVLLVDELVDVIFFDEACHLPEGATREFPGTHITKNRRPLTSADFWAIADPDTDPPDPKLFAFSHKCLLRDGMGPLTNQTEACHPRLDGSHWKGDVIVDFKEINRNDWKQPEIDEVRELNTEEPKILLRERVFNLNVDEFRIMYPNIQVSEKAIIKLSKVTPIWEQSKKELTISEILDAVSNKRLFAGLSFLKNNDFGSVWVFDPVIFHNFKDKEVWFLTPIEPNELVKEIVKTALGEDYQTYTLPVKPHISNYKIHIVPGNPEHKGGLYTKLGIISKVADDFLIPLLKKHFPNDWETLNYAKILCLTNDKKRQDTLGEKTDGLAQWHNKKNSIVHNDINHLQILPNFGNLTYYSNDKLTGQNIGELIFIALTLQKLIKMPLKERIFIQDRKEGFMIHRNQIIGRQMRHPNPGDKERAGNVCKSVLIADGDDETRREQAEEIKKYIAPHVIPGGKIEIMAWDEKRANIRLQTTFNRYLKNELSSILKLLFKSEVIGEDAIKAIEIELKELDNVKPEENNITNWIRSKETPEETRQRLIKVHDERKRKEQLKEQEAKEKETEEFEKFLKATEPETTELAPIKPAPEEVEEENNSENYQEIAPNPQDNDQMNKKVITGPEAVEEIQNQKLTKKEEDALSFVFDAMGLNNETIGLDGEEVQEQKEQTDNTDETTTVKSPENNGEVKQAVENLPEPKPDIPGKPKESIPTPYKKGEGYKKSVNAYEEAKTNLEKDKEHKTYVEDNNDDSDEWNK